MGTRRKREKLDYIKKIATDFINNLPNKNITYKLIDVKNEKPQGYMYAIFEMIDEDGKTIIYDDSEVVVFVDEDGRVGFYDEFHKKI